MARLRFRNTICVLLTNMAVAFLASAMAWAEQPIAALDGSAKGTRLKYGSPDYAYQQILRSSPDGRFIARLLDGEGEAAYLTVYPAHLRKHRYLKQDAVSRDFEDAHGCVWVPGHGHWLVVSVGGADYGRGMIALWTGHGRTRYLRYAKAPEDEGFNIRNVSSDGRFIVYEHFGENSLDPDYKRNTHYKLFLPKS